MLMIHVYVARNSYYYSRPFLAALPACLLPSRPGTTQGTISARGRAVDLRRVYPCDTPHPQWRPPITLTL
ncbi:hypothetical protein E2C01_078292 [Portunus trituberculatus]|uniref:Uncharacterized protein n=1 Tax=Portunus trituberculatus TaxID=210409 RepID=A0A5B7IGL9_PORTR|nr:hypothetical protein [Portunus trituberculatus]